MAQRRVVRCAHPRSRILWRRCFAPHALMINLIGDADLCADALGRAKKIAALSRAPLLNPPALVAATGRLKLLARLGALPSIETPRMRLFSRQDFCQIDNEAFPLLLRAEGFHAGRHFHRVERREDLAAALATLPGDKIIAMSPLMRGAPTGCIANTGRRRSAKQWFPHLAVSADRRSIISAPTWAPADSPRRGAAFPLTVPTAPRRPRLGGARRRSPRRSASTILASTSALAPNGALRVFSRRGDGDVDPPPEPMGLPPPRPCRRARAAAREMVLRHSASVTIAQCGDRNVGGAI